MVSPVAAGQRFLATGEFAWMQEMAEVLRANLVASASRVSLRTAPDFLVRPAARRDPAIREITPLGRRNRHCTAKA
jgi:hypothetical protein